MILLKIRRINATDYFVYLYDKNYSLVDIENDLDNIIDMLKKIIPFSGFYKILVSVKKIGLFLKIVFLKEAFYRDTIDWKIEVGDFDIYYKTKNYSLIKNYSYLFHRGYYIVSVDELDTVLSLVEFGIFDLRGDCSYEQEEESFF